MLEDSARSAYFDTEVCHPNADSYMYKDRTSKQLYKNQEREKAQVCTSGYKGRTRDFYSFLAPRMEWVKNVSDTIAD